MGFGAINAEYQPLDETKKPIPLYKLALATICFAGVQFGWALQISQLTPFIQELGLPKFWSSVVWLCGPIAGLLVQPVVGVWSDSNTAKLGRRRPFIITGAVFVVVALLLIPNAPDLGHLLGDSHTNNTAALVIAIGAFWILDLSNNTLQGPCRALIPDIAPSSQQSTGNAMFSLWLGIGNVAGYMAGFVDWAKIFPWVMTDYCDNACGSLRVAFSMSCILLSLTTLITCVFTPEEPLPPSGPSAGCCRTIADIFIPIFRAIGKMPVPMIRIVAVQFFSWFGWFCFLINITDWVGEDVYGGDAQAPANSPALERYTEGVRWGSFGLAGYAVVSIITSPFIPILSDKIGARWVWAFGNLVLSVCLGLTFVIKTKYLAFALISAFGIPWSTTMVVPYALTGLIAPEEERGLYMGVLNIFVVLPQVVVAVISPLILHHFKDVTSMMITGSGVSLIAVPLCYFLIMKKIEHPSPNSSTQP